MRAPVPSSQHATQRACDAIGCPSSTAGNSPDIRDKFSGHPSLARWLTSHHGLHTTSGTPQQQIQGHSLSDCGLAVCPVRSARGAPRLRFRGLRCARTSCPGVSGHGLGGFSAAISGSAEFEDADEEEHHEEYATSGGSHFQCPQGPVGVLRHPRVEQEEHGNARGDLGRCLNTC